MTTSRFNSGILLFISTVITISGFQSCTNDVMDPCNVTYELEVRSIIDKSCAYSGCHSGSTAGNYVPASSKDYTTFEGLMATVASGKFAERVIDFRNMPPAAFVPAGKPVSLTADEIEKLTCWLESGHPER